jgi:hypothetical protein
MCHLFVDSQCAKRSHVCNLAASADGALAMTIDNAIAKVNTTKVLSFLNMHSTLRRAGLKVKLRLTLVTLDSSFILFITLFTRFNTMPTTCSTPGELWFWGTVLSNTCTTTHYTNVHFFLSLILFKSLRASSLRCSSFVLSFSRNNPFEPFLPAFFFDITYFFLFLLLYSVSFGQVLSRTSFLFSALLFAATLALSFLVLSLLRSAFSLIIRALLAASRRSLSLISYFFLSRFSLRTLAGFFVGSGRNWSPGFLPFFLSVILCRPSSYVHCGYATTLT